ncbi:MAG: M20/M25/M40 family metallo-hydrolase, partial [Armatimonadetes bacterium]|nr:M20/M25/M40 family metallo-hydrolase [Armatimonadota bacterium]
VLESAPGRGSVVLRLPGRNDAEPLMLLSHLDVVAADAGRWKFPPFSGALADGCVWGRGTLDTKNLTAMELMAVLLVHRLKVPLARSLIFAATADEEAGGRAGIAWLLDHHPELVTAPYVINEGAGYDVRIAGKKFYTCQMGEKGGCRVVMRTRGRPGHVAFPQRGTAIARLVEALGRLEQADPPMHVSASVRALVDHVASRVDAAATGLMHDLLDPRRSRAAVEALPADETVRSELYAMLRNTTNVTVVHAGEAVRAIPTEASAWIDGRLVPGATPESFVAELREVVGDGVDLQVEHFNPGTEFSARTPLYQAICDVVAEHDPEASAVPWLVVGGTDARHLVRKMKTTVYGFKPMQQDPQAPRNILIHGDDERTSVEGFLFGTRVIFDLVMRFCT